MMTTEELLNLDICRGVTLREALSVAENEGLFDSNYNGEDFETIAQTIIDAACPHKAGGV